MSDYQATYDAVTNALSYVMPHLQQEIYSVSGSVQRPSVLYRPAVSIDGNKWCALYGDNLQDGVAGFGDTPAEAMADFDKNWNGQRLAVG